MDIALRYSLAHAVVKPGETSFKHALKTSEIYIILEGKGRMVIDKEAQEVSQGHVVYIPPNAVQCIENIGTEDLIFYCIVDPAGEKKMKLSLNPNPNHSTMKKISPSLANHHSPHPRSTLFLLSDFTRLDEIYVVLPASLWRHIYSFTKNACDTLGTLFNH